MDYPLLLALVCCLTFSVICSTALSVSGAVIEFCLLTPEFCWQSFACGISLFFASLFYLTPAGKFRERCFNVRNPISLGGVENCLPTVANVMPGNVSLSCMH